MKLSVEALRLKFRNKIYIPLTRASRREKLTTEQFTIISNNCWGGTVYESYGLEKQSPTIGMFIMPDDYLKFIADLDHYLSQKPEFISCEESKWREKLGKKDNWGHYIIARLDDIELQMLHYHDEDAALKKWERRIKRINRDKIIFKFNDQNGCTIEHIKRFMMLPHKNKLCFVSKKEMKINDEVILLKQPKRYKDGIKASREPFGNSKKINVTAYINAIGESDSVK